MGKIKVLTEDIISKISAGEVIERPASVVKEIIENSIDAGSDRITVITKNGGQDLIQIVDNGIGMTQEDAKLAFERHATSKLSNYEDLYSLKTLGFRGEALASIGAVARIELKTKTKDETIGTLIKFEGGVITETGEIATSDGTSVSIKNLFYNTPARRHFMKSANTEFRNILNVFKKFAISYPEIEFQFFNNDERLFDLKRVQLEERIEEVLKKRLNEDSIYISAEDEDMKIYGYIGKPDVVRQSRGDQFIFLNKRTIMNRTINHAIFSGYGTTIAKGDFPFFVVFIELNSKLVDVNVHPTKMEVKFSNEKEVYNFIHRAVKISLNTSSVIPKIDKDITSYLESEIRESISGKSKISPRNIPKNYRSKIVPSNQYTLSYVEPTIEVEKEKDEHKVDYDESGIWQLHNKYILSQIKSGLVIIDQHVAHERVLYEKVLNTFDLNDKPVSQQLLFPQTLELSMEDWAVFNDILSFLEKMGFVLKEFSGRTIVIEAIPAEVKIGNEGKILMDVIDNYKENEYQGLTDIKDNFAKSFACKNAIKAGDRLNIEEMHALIDQLFATKSPYFCPHGRPVIITLPLEELDKKFLREWDV